MEHPQDLTKITLSERFLVWWMKFYRYYIAWPSVINRPIRKDRCRHSTCVHAPRQYENKIFLKLLRGQETRISINNKDVFSIGCVHFEMEHHRDSFLDSAEPYISEIAIDSKGRNVREHPHLGRQQVYLRWWLERYIIKCYKKERKRRENAVVEYDFKTLDDAIVNFKTKNI